MKLLTVPQAAKLANVSQSAIYMAIERGAFASTVVPKPKRTRIREDELAEWINNPSRQRRMKVNQPEP